jgi:hypothetical protein
MTRAAARFNTSRKYQLHACNVRRRDAPAH